MNKLSVVVSAYNEEKNLEDCLKSVREISDEIIVVDNTSTDKTNSIAKKYADKVFVRENNLMLNVNKNYGISRATHDWVLLLDADERVTKELAQELKSLLSKDTELDGYTMPRKNIIFGKWIEHTGWYPDRQLRLFKKGKGKFAEKHVHEMIEVNGEVGELNEAIYHLNYKNISQFLDKMIRIYTISEAENLIKNGYKVKMSDTILIPTKEFVKRFFAEEGFKDGAHGLILSCLMAFYHLVVFVRVWELSKYPDCEDTILEFEKGKSEAKKEVKYWLNLKKLEMEKNPVSKISRRLLQKISL